MTDYVALEKEMAALSVQLEQALANEDAEALIALNEKLQALHEKAFGPVDSYSLDILEPPYEALRDAIEDGDLEALRAALLPGLDLNQPQGKFDSVPLIWALMAEGRSVDIVQMLLDHGADAALASGDGYTPLHFIADTNYLDEHIDIPSKIVAALIAAGADIEARQHYGWTPLHRAIMEGNVIEAEALLLNGADPNSHYTMVSMPVFSKGYTPLMQAGSDTGKVRLLLKYGADPVARSLGGQATLDYFEKSVVEARAELAAQRASGGDTEFEQSYADGFAASRELIKQAMAAKN